MGSFLGGCGIGSSDRTKEVVCFGCNWGLRFRRPTDSWAAGIGDSDCGTSTMSLSVKVGVVRSGDSVISLPRGG